MDMELGIVDALKNADSSHFRVTLCIELMISHHPSGLKPFGLYLKR
jgi:hypothetical protein